MGPRAALTGALLLCAAACRPAALEDCSSAGDEDEDGFTDCEDPDCGSRFDCADRWLDPSLAFQSVEVHRVPNPDLSETRVRFAARDMDLDGRTDFLLARMSWDEDGDDSTHVQDDEQSDVFVVLSSRLPDAGDAAAEDVGIRLPVLAGMRPEFAILHDQNGNGFPELLLWDIRANTERLQMEGPTGVRYWPDPGLGPEQDIKFLSYDVPNDEVEYWGGGGNFGDLDCDGLDEFIVAGTELTNIKAILAAETWPEAGVGYLPFLGNGLGDLDHDGCADLWLPIGGRTPAVRDGGTYDWRVGWWLPGQPGLMTGGLSLSELDRQPLEIRFSTSAHGTSETLCCSTSVNWNWADGRPEEVVVSMNGLFTMSVPFPPQPWGPGPILLDGDGPHLDWPRDWVYEWRHPDWRGHYETQRASSRLWGHEDIDGDGLEDWIYSLDFPAAGNASLLRRWEDLPPPIGLFNPRQWAGGIGILFGREGARLRGPEALWDMDVVIASLRADDPVCHGISPGSTRFVEDRDGDGVRDLMFVAGVGIPNGEPRPAWMSPTVGFLSGALIASYKP